MSDPDTTAGTKPDAAPGAGEDTPRDAAQDATQYAAPIAEADAIEDAARNDLPEDEKTTLAEPTPVPEPTSDPAPELEPDTTPEPVPDVVLDVAPEAVAADAVPGVVPEVTINGGVGNGRPGIDAGVRAALDTRLRPEPPGPVANALTFGWRAILKIKHLPEQLFDVVVTPVMFTVMFTYLFGGALAGSPDAYLQFLLPGILAQTVIFGSIYTGFTLNTDIQKGIFDRFRSMPIWVPSPIVGAMLGDTARYTASSLIVFAIGFVMGYRPETGALGVVAAVLFLNLFALGIGWIFTAVALLVRTPSTVMTLSWLVLMPLTFVSNIFVEPQTMPVWLQAFVAVNPVTHLVTALRGMLDGTATFGAIALALLAPVALTAVFAPATMWLYARRR